MLLTDSSEVSTVGAEEVVPPSDYCPNPRYPNPLKTDVSEIIGKWWIGWTRPQYEKRFAAALFDLRIEHYLPLSRRISTAGAARKRHLVETPLFPSYVFFAGDEYAVYDARGTKRLLQVIPVINQAKLVKELKNVQSALGINPDLRAGPKMTKGVRVRVKSGPMMGIEGVFLSEGRNGNLQLEVSVLGQVAEMKIASDDVEIAD